MQPPSNTLNQLLGSPTPFLNGLFAALAEDRIDVSSYELDHLCYRVVELKRYEELKDQLTLLGSLLGENIIGGRPIATFQLQEPIHYRERKIQVLELPAPKSGRNYPEGYEHVEFVIDQPFEAFMAQYPKLKFETKGINKLVNADIQLQYQGFGVKFHRQSLANVIARQQSILPDQ